MIKKGDKVKILTGKDKKKMEKLLKLIDQIIEQKLKELILLKNMLKQQKKKKGGIISKENFINISNLSIFEKKKKKKKKIKNKNDTKIKRII